MLKWNNEYQVYVSDDGRVWNKNHHEFKLQLNRGYYRVFVRYGNKIRKRWLVHILVYETFCGKIPQGMQVDHKDRNRLNNKLDNLKLVTPSENNVNRVLPKFRRVTSDFGKKFYEHFHIKKRDNLPLYNHHYHYFRYYGKCEWE